MKLQYFGTAAAEGVPALFCTCPVCVHARRNGGKNIRTRFQALADDTLLLDFPPDTYMHYITHGFDLPGISQLLITHSHSDHFYPLDFEMRSPSYCHPGAPVLHIYGNEQVQKGYEQIVQVEPKVKLYNAFHHVKPGECIWAGAHQVTPLLALHNRQEECLIYLIEKDGQSLLFAHDTGIFPEAS